MNHENFLSLSVNVTENLNIDTIDTSRSTMLTVDTTIFSSKTSIMLPSSHYYFGSSGCLVIQKECHYDHQAHKKVSIIAISGLIQTL